MKKISIAAMLLLSFNAFSQTIVDMAGERQNKHYHGGDYYIKDINAFFDPYEGTWQYVDGTSEFRVTLTKAEMYHEVFTEPDIDYYFDGLLISYEKYENGSLVFESPDDLHPSGMIKEFGKLRMSFMDYERYITNTVMNITNHASHRGFFDLLPNGSGDYDLKFKLLNERTSMVGEHYEPATGDPYHSTPYNVIMTKM